MSQSSHAPRPIPRPSALKLLLESRAVGELVSSWLAMPWLKSGPAGDGHPVLTLPGFIASDLSTTPLRRFLDSKGYSAHPWNLGRNFGPRPGIEDVLLRRLEELSRRHGRKVSVIGWSLGGLYARDLAHRAPEHVRSVICLGSPFTGDPRANNSWRLYELLSETRLDEVPEERFERLRTTPPVPTTCIYSQGDGITHWSCCVDKAGPQSENIRVPGSHCGLGWNPLVLYAIADRLAQPEGDWQPFHREGQRRFLYPEPAAADS